MSTTTHPAEINGSYITPDGKAQIDFGITYRNGYAEFHAQGHYDGSAGQCLEEIAKAYPKDRMAKLILTWKGYSQGVMAQSQMQHAIGNAAQQHPARSFYEHQAQNFLSSNGLKLRATLSDSKPAPWSPAGHHYRVTISRSSESPAFQFRSMRRITFDFWDSIANAEKLAKPTAYSILACISSEAHCPDTFEDWCSEYGESTDSLKARQTFARNASFARRLRAFFTPAELEQLSDIQ